MPEHEFFSRMTIKGIFFDLCRVCGSERCRDLGCDESSEPCDPDETRKRRRPNWQWPKENE